MQFLDGCRKSEEEGKAGQARAPVKAKVRAAAATLPPKEDRLSKQLKYQQHQIDALVGANEGLGSSGESHAYLPKSGQEWVFL